MNVNFDALSRMTKAVEIDPARQEQENEHEKDEALLLAQQPEPEVSHITETHGQSRSLKADADGVIAQEDEEALRFSSTSVETPVPEPKSKPSKFWAWKRPAKSKAAPVTESAAKKKNQARFAIIGACVFAAGIVVAPWLMTSEAHQEPAKPMGPNAAAMVASTLNSSALGVPLTRDAVSAALENSAVAAPTTTTNPSPAVIPESGESRYLAMLGAIKEGKPTTAIPPPIEVTNRSVAAATKNHGNTAPAPVKQISAVPLQIEMGSETATSAQSSDATEPPAKASDLYKLVRIERNQVGELVAYLARLGGRDSTQGAWIFVGDSTTEGFYIETITAYHVRIRTPNGRVEQLVP